MLEMFRELQLIEEIEIFGIAIGMIIRKRAPKSNMWRKVVAVFRLKCSRGCLSLFIFCLRRRQGLSCSWPGGEILVPYYLSP